MPSQWPAVGAETDPLRRARQLQKSWERLLADGALGPELPPGATAGLRPTIVESWRRSLATGLDPTDLLAPIEADQSEVLGRWFEHPLGSLTDVLTQQLGKVAEESRSIVVVTDASGLVLHRLGDEWLKERAAEMNLVEGARYSEAADGTNGIGTALAADHAFQVFAFEHFNERHHQWICSGAPVHDPMSGRVVGLVDLSSLWKIAHPRSLELVTTAARTIEQCLLEVRRDQDARLRRRYGDLMTRSTDLLVNRDGYVLAGVEREHSRPLDVPEGGGEFVFGDGSVALAEPLGQGEAYLLRQVTARHARSARVEVLERAERHVRELVTEQAALRQVATLVARESSRDQLFAAVAEQVARVFDVPHVRLVRYEPEGSVVVGGFSEDDDEPFPIGSRWPLDSPGVAATVRQTGRPARVEDYAHMTGEIAAVVRAAGMRSTVASPIVVERRLWGAMVLLSPRHKPFPESTEARLTDFTELVATAIANAESRAALARLADEQAALQRVATLVAQGARPAEIFSRVGEEIGRLFGSEVTTVGRFEAEGPALVAVGLGKGNEGIPVGSRWELDDLLASAQVFRTGRSARVDDLDWLSVSGPLAPIGRHIGIASTVACPIFVEGRLWGVVSVSSDEQLPPDAEKRLEKFSELVATAISNAESKSELTASRRRIVAASDESRRRIERNLHDGTQQRLVSLALAVRAAEANLAPDRQDVQDQLSRVAIGLADAVEDLQEISRGIHPAILSKGGLGPALQVLAQRSAIPVDLEITTDARLEEPIEVAAYFVASEALANAAKHSAATRIDVSLERRDCNLLLSVRDNGVGGADAALGSGIVGLNDRVEALGGSLRVDSSPGDGTRIVAQLPLDLELERPV
jgi:signal transduction histidine kinase